MTEKRYKFVDLGETWSISVDGECKYYMHRVEDCKEVVELLNENEELKKEISNRDEVNKRLQNYNNRKRAENERLHRDWDKLYQLCLDKGFTEDELIKELER